MNSGLGRAGPSSLNAERGIVPLSASPNMKCDSGRKSIWLTLVTTWSSARSVISDPSYGKPGRTSRSRRIVKREKSMGIRDFILFYFFFRFQYLLVFRPPAKFNSNPLSPNFFGKRVVPSFRDGIVFIALFIMNKMALSPAFVLSYPKIPQVSP